MLAHGGGEWAGLRTRWSSAGARLDGNVLFRLLTQAGRTVAPRLVSSIEAQGVAQCSLGMGCGGGIPSDFVWQEDIAL